MKTMIKKISLSLTLLFPFWADAQCAMCRAVLENQDGGNAAAAINDGIVYLMIFPYLLMGGVGYFVWRTLKKRKETR